MEVDQVSAKRKPDGLPPPGGDEKKLRAGSPSARKSPSRKSVSPTPSRKSSSTGGAAAAAASGAANTAGSTSSSQQQSQQSHQSSQQQQQQSQVHDASREKYTRPPIVLEASRSQVSIPTPLDARCSLITSCRLHFRAKFFEQPSWQPIHARCETKKCRRSTGETFRVVTRDLKYGIENKIDRMNFSDWPNWWFCCFGSSVAVSLFHNHRVVQVSELIRYHLRRDPFQRWRVGQKFFRILTIVQRICRKVASEQLE